MTVVIDLSVAGTTDKIVAPEDPDKWRLPDLHTCGAASTMGQRLVAPAVTDRPLPAPGAPDFPNLGTGLSGPQAR